MINRQTLRRCKSQSVTLLTEATFMCSLHRESRMRYAHILYGVCVCTFVPFDNGGGNCLLKKWVADADAWGMEGQPYYVSM